MIVITLTEAQQAEYKVLKAAVSVAAAPMQIAQKNLQAFIASLPGATGQRFMRAQLDATGTTLVLQ